MPELDPDRITVRVRLRPIGLDVMRELVGSGDLDPSLVDEVPTWTLGFTEVEWKGEFGYGCFPRT
jgi:hypothetical protein